jgi:hypothetical protein
MNNILRGQVLKGLNNHRTPWLIKRSTLSLHIINYTTWLIKRSKIPNKLHANTNYTWNLLTDASWTTSRTLDTERSIYAIPDASRLALHRAINSRSSSVPCNSTSDSRSILRLALHRARQSNAFLIQQQIRSLTSPRRSSERNSREWPVSLKWLHTDAQTKARRFNAHVAKPLLHIKY